VRAEFDKPYNASPFGCCISNHGTAIHVIPLPTTRESWQSELIGPWDLAIDSRAFPKHGRLKFANALKKPGNPFTVPATKLRISGQKGFLRIIHAV
jgi:hypothetical protein